MGGCVFGLAGWFGFGLVVSGLVDFVAVLVGVVIVLWVVVDWLVCFGSGRLFWGVLCGWLICFGLFCVLYGWGFRYLFWLRLIIQLIVLWFVIFDLYDFCL